MPNHWHMVLWPEKEGQLTAFLRWLTHTHRLRWHAHYHTGGTGHTYQGRCKSFPVESDDHRSPSNSHRPLRGIQCEQPKVLGSLGWQRFSCLSRLLPLLMLSPTELSNEQSVGIKMLIAIAKKRPFIFVSIIWRNGTNRDRLRSIN